MRRVLGIAFSALSLLLAACGGGGTTQPPGPTAPAVETVSVTAPASNNLKIGEAVQFGASAKDDKGAEVTGKTFTWASSDNNLATVDAEGKVTARRFGKVKITATVDGKTGESAEQTTWGLEAVGGTSVGSRVTDGRVGTGLLLRFRKASGTSPEGPVSFRVVGPPGFNGGQPVTASARYGTPFSVWWITGPFSEIRAGRYTAYATIEGVEHSTEFEIANISSTLPIPGPPTYEIVGSQMNVSWQPVAGAVSYLVDIQEQQPNRWLFVANRETTSTSVTIDNLNLDPTKTYLIGLLAFNYDHRRQNADTAPFPAQFNRSERHVWFSTATGPTLTLSTWGGWAAFQDGDGPWRFMGRGGDTFILPIADPQGRYSVAAGWDSGLRVYRFTLADSNRWNMEENRVQGGFRCGDDGLTRDANVTTNITVTAPKTRVNVVAYRQGDSNRVPTYANANAAPTATFNVAQGNYEVFVWQRQADASGNSTSNTSRTMLRQTLNVAAGNSTQAVDFSTAGVGVESVASPVATVSLVPSGWDVALTSAVRPAYLRFTCHTHPGMGFSTAPASAGDTPTRSITPFTMPSSFFINGDRKAYFLDATPASNTTATGQYARDYRIVDTASAVPSTFQLPPAVSGMTSASAGGFPTVSGLSTSFDLDKGNYTLSWSQAISASQNNRYWMEISQRWLQAAGVTSLTFPDLTALPNATPNFRLGSGEVSWNFGKISLENATSSLTFLQDLLPNRVRSAGQFGRFTP